MKVTVIIEQHLQTQQSSSIGAVASDSLTATSLFEVEALGHMTGDSIRELFKERSVVTHFAQYTLQDVDVQLPTKYSPAMVLDSNVLNCANKTLMLCSAIKCAAVATSSDGLGRGYCDAHITDGGVN